MIGTIFIKIIKVNYYEKDIQVYQLSYKIRYKSAFDPDAYFQVVCTMCKKCGKKNMVKYEG